MKNRTFALTLAFLASSLAACTGTRLRGGASGTASDAGDVPSSVFVAAPAPPPCAPPPCAKPCPPPCAPAPCAPPCDPCRPFFADYVPAVPVASSRAMYTTLAMPTSPWTLTESEAGTPARGRVAFNLARVSDERKVTDDNGNTFEFDGEVQVATLEVVSPRMYAPFGCCRVPFHLAGSLSAYTLNYAWYDGLRNFVEEDIVGWSNDIKEAHTLQGRELSVTPTAGGKDDLLGSSPMWKARGVLKVPLKDRTIDGAGVSSAVSLGLTAPSFGSHSDSGNSEFAVDLTWALAIPLSNRWRLTGAVNVALPGKSDKLDGFGIDHQTIVAGGIVSIEWWISHRVALAAGVTVNGPYTRDSGLPTDLVTGYGNLGLLWRASERSEVHILFTENFEPGIAVDGMPPTSTYDGGQKDADFNITLGGSFDF